MNVNELKYFVGKVCTIFTCPINRDFKSENPTVYPKQVYVYFLGKIDSITESGIMLSQLLTGLKTFLFLSQVVGISEEEVIDEKKHAQEIEAFKKQSNPYVDPNALANLVKKMKTS